LRQSSGVPRPKPTSESASERERRLYPRAARVEPLSFRRAPLLAAALCFALGESLTQLPPATPRPAILLLLSAGALALLTLLALRRAFRLATSAVLALWIAAGLWSAQLQPAPSPQTALLAYADGLSRTVEGRVVRVRTLPPRQQRDNAASGNTDAGNADSDPNPDPDQWDEPAGAEANSTPALSLDLALTAIEDVTPDASRMVPIAGGVRATILARNRAQPQIPDQLPLRCGDLVEIPMRLRAPERYRDPGAWQYADYLLLDQGTAQGIAATANVAATKVRLLASPTQTPLANLAARANCRIFAAQSWAAGRLLAYTRSTPNRRLPPLLRLTPDDAGMLNAMLFGDRSRLSHALRLGFERTGSFHLFVVSGMHVAVLAGLLFYFARRLRLGPGAATALTLAVISAYALLTGFGVPVQRALLMTAVFLLARLLSRSRNTLNALGAAALAVLVFSPRALFEASFQMTFLAIVAIAGIAMPLGERTFLPYLRAARNLGRLRDDPALLPRHAQFRLKLRFWSQACADKLHLPARTLPALLRLVLRAAELALIALVAEAVMVLPMALYFHRATVFALPANLLSIPLVGVLLPLGIATFLASLLSPWLAALPGAALAFLLHAVTAAIHRLSHAQAADLRVPGPTLAHSLAALACLAFCCWAVRRSRAYAWAAVAALPLAAAIVLWPTAPVLHSGQLEVTAIDVGQGDSLLVVSPAGHAMLIDAGGPTGAAANAENAAGLLSSDSAFDIGEEVVSPYLWSRQLRRLDIVALTHAHSDHMGGMPAILRNFRPRELWVAVDPDSAPYRALLAEAAQLGIVVRHLRAGDRQSWDGIAISVLAPTPAYVNPGPPVNNDSLVLRMTFGQSSALLEGDAEAPSEHAMVAAALASSSRSAALSSRGSALSSRSAALSSRSAAEGSASYLSDTAPAAQLGPDTLLKVGHHGSRTSTTPEFLALTAPQDAVISVGANNTFGHPRPEIIARLAAAHARLFRTDRFGLTTFLLSRDGRIAAFPGASNP
jgi:competence protein ComEC